VAIAAGDRRAAAGHFVHLLADGGYPELLDECAADEALPRRRRW
jgi:hypothetical protein